MPFLVHGSMKDAQKDVHNSIQWSYCYPLYSDREWLDPPQYLNGSSKSGGGGQLGDALLQYCTPGQDVLISLPTGFRKSLIYWSLPAVFDRLRRNSTHISSVDCEPFGIAHDRPKGKVPAQRYRSG